MVDAAVGFVRSKESVLDGVEGHGRVHTTFREEARRVKPDNGTWPGSNHKAHVLPNHGVEQPELSTV
jgi:hypothetical protein